MPGAQKSVVLAPGEPHRQLDGGRDSGSVPAPKPLPPRQRQVLDAVKRHFHGRLESNRRNYMEIASKIGCRDAQFVVICLFALRDKGYMRSEGNLTSRPDRWIVVEPQSGEAVRQHEAV